MRRTCPRFLRGCRLRSAGISVTTSHPAIGKSGDPKVAQYQFFVEQGALKFSVELPPTVTSLLVPPAILAGGGTFKLEIIARTATGNNTAVENCFVVK